jgi:hypothetical protein
VQRGLLTGARGGEELDGRVSAALRTLQRQEGLAATGFPDRETLRKLGLDPSDVYRNAEDTARAPGER